MWSRREAVTILRIHFTDEHASEATGTSDHVRAATEATCEALLAIELLEAADGPDRSAQDRLHLSQATVSLRRAVAELRLASTDAPGVLTLGFVLEPKRVKRCRTAHGLSLQPAPDGVDRGLDATG